MDKLGYMLEYGVDLLNNRSIRNWLDCGTLLGAVREQRLLTWEKDIDLGALKDQVDHLDILYIINRARKDGYDVNVYDTSISISKNGYVLDIKLYEKRGDIFFENKRIPKNLFSSTLCYLVHCFSSDYLTSREGLNIFRNFVITIIHMLSKIIPRQLSKIIIYPIKYLCDNYLTIDISEAVPCKYFETFEEIKFLGKSYTIPEKKEDYLAFRYGENWRVPNKNWITERDDGGYLYVQNKK